MLKVMHEIDRYGKSLEYVDSARGNQNRIEKRRETKRMDVRQSSVVNRYEYVEREHVVNINQQEKEIVIIEGGGGVSSRVNSGMAVVVSRGVSLQMMDRIFKKNMRKNIARWRKGIEIQSEGLIKTLSAFKDKPE